MAYKNFKTYDLNVAISFDQFVNALAFGHPDETLSSRCYRLSERYWYARWCRVFLDFIFRPLGPGHCKQAYNSEKNNKHNFTAKD